MFEKKQVIFSGNIGVCRVEDIVKLSTNKTDIYTYYLLRSVNDKTRTSYIPVEGHMVELRELISVDEAKRKRCCNDKQISTIERGEIEYVLQANSCN